MDNNMVIQSIKLTVAAAASLLIHYLGGNSDLLALFGGLIASDFVLGVLKGLKTKTFRSSIVRWGAVNKVLEVILIMIFNQFDTVTHVNMFKNGTIVWFCVCEAGSIFENLSILGVPFPEGLQDLFSKIKVGVSVNFIEMFKKVLAEKLPGQNDDNDSDKNNS